jgi:hypothetical protein
VGGTTASDWDCISGELLYEFMALDDKQTILVSVDQNAGIVGCVNGRPFDQSMAKTHQIPPSSKNVNRVLPEPSSAVAADNGASEGEEGVMRDREALEAAPWTAVVPQPRSARRVVLARCTLAAD